MGPARVGQCVQDHSFDSGSFRTGNDLFYSVHGVGNGVWGLRELATETPEASDIDPPFGMHTDAPEGASEHKLSGVYRILRDTELARSIKDYTNIPARSADNMFHYQGEGCTPKHIMSA